MTKTDQSLTENLAAIGISHKPSKINNKRDWFKTDGTFIGSFDAADGWVMCEKLTAEADATSSAARGRSHSYAGF